MGLGGGSGPLPVKNKRSSKVIRGLAALCVIGGAVGISSVIKHNSAPENQEYPAIDTNNICLFAPCTNETRYTAEPIPLADSSSETNYLAQPIPLAKRSYKWKIRGMSETNQ